MADKKGYVYILMSWNNRVMYTGVTSNITRRMFTHRNKMADGFSKKYNVCKLVYYEIFNTLIDAITREKQIKGGSRKKKEMLVKAVNPEFKDLFFELE